METTKIKKIGLGFLAILSGSVLPLAFAPFGYYWVAEISLLLLLFVWMRAKPMSSFCYGWLFGVGFFSFGVYWVYNSIHDYGKAPAVLAIAILALLVAFLSLYPAILGYFMNRFFPKNSLSKFLLVFPAGFVILEWIRGWFLSGFPWLFLGYGHIDSYLSGFAAIFGVYGVSFAVTLSAGAIFSMFYWWKNIRVVFSLFLLLVFIWGTGFILTGTAWTKQVGEEIQVSLIQGNISQEEKWESNMLWSILNSYNLLTIKSLDSKIIVWPEAAIPTYPDEVRLYLDLLSFAAEKSDTTILAGAPFYDREDKLYYNGILAFGNNDGRYYKRKLVPFGEYMPLKSILKWMGKFLVIPMSDFSSGSSGQFSLYAKDILIAPFVCYEISYPDLVLDYMPKAGLLVTVSDDSWFGESIAPYQHLEIARMRSLEVGRYQLFSTNTGITAIMDGQGQILDKTSMSAEIVLTSRVKNMIGSTPWVKYGQYLWLPLLLLGLVLSFVRRKYCVKSEF